MYKLYAFWSAPKSEDAEAGSMIEEFGVSMTVAIGDDVVTPGQPSYMVRSSRSRRRG